MILDFIHIRKRITPITILQNEIVGNIVPNNDDEVKMLLKLSENNCVDEIVKLNDHHQEISKILPLTQIQIKLYPHQLTLAKYFEDTSMFLKFESQCVPNVPYYIYSLDYYSASESTNKKPNFIENYEAATKLIDFLRSTADYIKGNELVFFQAKQLILITDYNDSALCNLNNIPILIDHISTSVDKEERKIIFINELITSLNSINEKSLRFNYLLMHFNELFASYQKSHSLYLEKYSYQKFKSDIDKEMIEYTKKIQSVINDAQSKLVAIPAAFLLIVNQVDLTGIKLYYNLMLLISSFIFCVLLELLLRNQFSALDFISDDLKRFKNSINNEKSNVLGEEITIIFTKIDRLYKKQKCYLNIIRYIVWFTPLFALMLFIISFLNNAYVLKIKAFLSSLM